jgi:hypothetical protein
MSCHSAGITWPRAEPQTDSSLRDQGCVRFRQTEGESESRVRHPGVESIWAREARCTTSSAPWSGEPEGRQRSSVVAMQESGPGAVSRSRRCGPCRTFGLARPLVRYESIRPTELYEYCAGIAPIAPSPAQRSQSLTHIRPSFLRCSAQRLRVRCSHQKES